MKQQILVAYASKHGATAEIAQVIGEQLAQAGHHVDVKAVDDVADPGAYDAVVLGSAVYVGNWRKEAARFLEEQAAILAQRPLWLFSSGPTGEGDPADLMKGWRFPEKLQPLADRLDVRDIAVFHGVLDAEKLNFMERLVVKGVKAPMGDFREWDEIRAWGAKIIADLQESVVDD